MTVCLAKLDPLPRTKVSHIHHRKIYRYIYTFAKINLKFEGRQVAAELEFLVLINTLTNLLTSDVMFSSPLGGTRLVYQ